MGPAWFFWLMLGVFLGAEVMSFVHYITERLSRRL